MTGWGQTGPLAKAAGHDLNYIAITGALHAIGRRGEKPVVPLNLIGDMGGGGMLLANGVLAALLEASQSGQGQVIDVAMVDGAAQLMWMMQGMQQQGFWNEEQREANLLDGAAHFYDTYECADGKYVAIGSIEPQFYQLLIEITGVDKAAFQQQMDASRWPAMKATLAEAFRQRTRDEWCELMEGSDVCFAPVLTMSEATDYPANVERGVYLEVDGITQPAPAPRFSRTPSHVAHGPRPLGADTCEVLRSVGMAASEIDALLDCGAIAAAGADRKEAADA
jgi:alpha-methylacyl-CoA racemase